MKLQKRELRSSDSSNTQNIQTEQQPNQPKTSCFLDENETTFKGRGRGRPRKIIASQVQVPLNN